MSVARYVLVIILATSAITIGSVFTDWLTIVLGTGALVTATAAYAGSKYCTRRN
jgi:hypothetical protein